MKKCSILIMMLALVMLASSCTKKGGFASTSGSDRAGSNGEFEVLVSRFCPLYRYVDQKYGVVIYISSNGRITSQKLNPADRR